MSISVTENLLKFLLICPDSLDLLFLWSTTLTFMDISGGRSGKCLDPFQRNYYNKVVGGRAVTTGSKVTRKPSGYYRVTHPREKVLTKMQIPGL